jgi:hypothetical protein
VFELLGTLNKAAAQQGKKKDVMRKTSQAQDVVEGFNWDSLTEFEKRKISRHRILPKKKKKKKINLTAHQK